MHFFRDSDESLNSSKKSKNKKKTPEEDAKGFEKETRKKGKKTENDFVSYFFKKNGIKYVAILTNTKKKYEERTKSYLSKAKSDMKKNAKSFVATVHEAKKVFTYNVLRLKNCIFCF
jgi:hypothetical protein